MYSQENRRSRRVLVAAAKGNVADQSKQASMVHRILFEPNQFKYPAAPDGLTIYAVGDIHGRADLLDRIHQLIDKDKNDSESARNIEIYLGDYIDRGPDSAKVVSFLIKRSSLTSTIFLRGNHEQLLMDFLDGKDCWPQWRAVGCISCCLSYGVSSNLLFGHVSEKVLRQALAEHMPMEHVKFYADTGSYCRVEPYLFVHAGIRPGITLKDQNPTDLLNIRKSFLEFEGDLGYVVVHGHTPVEFPDLRKHRINID